MNIKKIIKFSFEPVTVPFGGSLLSCSIYDSLFHDYGDLFMLSGLVGFLFGMWLNYHCNSQD
jgi:hypothetical protein